MLKKFIDQSIKDIDSGNKKAIIKVGAAAIVLPGGIAIFAGLVGYMAYKWIKNLNLNNKKNINLLITTVNRKITESKNIKEQEKIKHKLEVAKEQEKKKKISKKIKL